MDGGGKCIGAEALLRWNHPDYGFIYPPLIIYLAKEGKILPELEREIFDMAIKAIRAGIPVLASKASPSAEAVAMAKEYQLTLICAARRDRMKLFNGNNPTE